MEPFVIYLFRSAVWIAVFTLVYWLFLRNERFFLLNRIYLVSGMIASFILPFVTVRYVVELPLLQPVVTAGDASAVVVDTVSAEPVTRSLPAMVWLAGVVLLLVRQGVQTAAVLRAARRAERVEGYPVRVLRSPDFTGSFSWFSMVVVNPSLSETEISEIMKHEMVHVRQRHWVDLLLSTLLCTVQWFNPAAWFSARFIRQNHEYLADEGAVSSSADPALYRAVLLNQIAGRPVIEAGSYFSQSLNKKRFLMMKNRVTSPRRKLRLLLIVPAVALVLYAFAEPRYIFVPEESSGSLIHSVAAGEVHITPGDAAVTSYGNIAFIGDNLPDRKITGVVTDEHGKPMKGASVVITGTTTGTTTDASGRFTLQNVPSGSGIWISFVGYKAYKVDAGSVRNNLRITMQPEAAVTPEVTVMPPPPPGNRMSDALVVIDGKISDTPLSQLSPSEIAEIRVLKGENATEKYGERARNGVIEIVTVAAAARAGKPGPVVVEGHPLGSGDKAAGKPGEVVVVEGYPLEGGREAAGKPGVVVVEGYPLEGGREVAGKPGVVVVEGYPLEGSEKAAGKPEPVMVTGHPLENDKEFFIVVEQMPQFPGGNQARDAWIARNIRYPEQAARNGIAGMVYVSFVIERSGKVTRASVVRSVDPLLDAEAVRVVGAMPDWKPGLQRGEPVEVRLVLPVNFALQ